MPNTWSPPIHVIQFKFLCAFFIKLKPHSQIYPWPHAVFLSWTFHFKSAEKEEKIILNVKIPFSICAFLCLSLPPVKFLLPVPRFVATVVFCHVCHSVQCLSFFCASALLNVSPLLLAQSHAFHFYAPFPRNTCWSISYFWTIFVCLSLSLSLVAGTVCSGWAVLSTLCG